MRGDVLIVRHGPGRGRELAILPLIEAEIAAARPALLPHVRVHETGAPRPPLAGVGTVLFLLADPLKEFYPQCFAHAAEIAGEAKARGIAVLNPPESLSNSIKSRQAELWRKAGLRCAGARVIRSANDLEPAMAALGLPMILRSDDEHVQKGVRVCKRVKHVDEAKLTLRTPAVALQLIDVRAKWKEVSPDHVMARYHHKKRSMIYGDTVLNNHVFFSRSPIVGRSSSTFLADTSGLRRRLRHVGIGRKRWSETLAADYAYYASPPEARETMLRATAVLGFDVAAIDYSTLPDGDVVLWEANPYAHLPPWQHGVAAEPRRIRERTGRQISLVVEWLERLVEGRSRAA